MININFKENKGFRLLHIYERLVKGECLNKENLASSFNVTTKSIQRDIDDLRTYLAESYCNDVESCIKYNKQKGGYYLVKFERDWFTKDEALAISKIILESRAFNKKELKILLDKFAGQVAPADKNNFSKFIRNEEHHYIQLQHGKNIIKILWELSEDIAKMKKIMFDYERKDGVKKNHQVKPVAVMFSEFYFYLIAFMVDETKKGVTVFRVDRISNLVELKDSFKMETKNRFEEGEFRKRVQFMYSGELQKVKFKYSGPSLEAILDRLPTAEIKESKAGYSIIEAEAYGSGIFMWIKSQGDMIEVIER